LHGDFSPECLELMQERHPELHWLLLDARQLPFASSSLSAVVEKGERL
jgi:ubiquinone/menaquinone biosynthesis C-methylase UbiE